MFVIFECNSAIPIRNAVSTCVFESDRSSWGLVLAAWLFLKGMVRQAVWGTFIGPVIQSLRFHSFSLSLDLKILAHDHACSALETTEAAVYCHLLPISVAGPVSILVLRSDEFKQFKPFSWILSKNWKIMSCISHFDMLWLPLPSRIVGVLNVQEYRHRQVQRVGWLPPTVAARGYASLISMWVLQPCLRRILLDV